MTEINASEAYDPQEFHRQTQKLNNCIRGLKRLGINTVDPRKLSGHEGMAGCNRFTPIDPVVNIKAHLFAKQISEEENAIKAT